MVRRMALMVALVTGCTGLTDPDPADQKIRVETLVPLRIVGERESTVAQLPAVRVVDAGTRTPVAGRVVAFSVTSPSGSVRETSVTTGSDGVGRLQEWKLGSEIGLHTATARTEGWGPVRFSVMVPGSVIAIYDLKSINGIPMPYNLSITEEHIVLYESGVVNRFRNMPMMDFTYSADFTGTYWRETERIHLAMECHPVFFAQCVPEQKSLVVRGSELIYELYEPFYGGWIEVYALRNSP